MELSDKIYTQTGISPIVFNKNLWGRAVSIDNFNRDLFWDNVQEGVPNKFYGHYSDRPNLSLNSIFTKRMQRTTIVCYVTNLRYEKDPRDMFFLKAICIGQHEHDTDEFNFFHLDRMREHSVVKTCWFNKLFNKGGHDVHS